MSKYNFWSYEKQCRKNGKCVRICVGRTNNFYTINFIGPTFKIILNPKRDFLYQDYKKERKCADKVKL
jgi:hypothetical protein